MQESVKKFMQAIGQECPNRPGFPSEEVMDLRWELIYEELCELGDAMDEKDLVGVADALGDLLVVVLGAGVAFGIDLNPVFEEIMRSNFTKVVDGSRREDGKWLKGPSYQPPSLEPIIESQVNE